MGFTRAPRYANYKGGKKYDKEQDYAQLEKGSNSKADRLTLLHFFKKIVQQTYRFPDPDHKAAFEDEYAQELIDIADEQRFYDPDKWINAEIDYIYSTLEPRLTSDDVNKQLDIMQDAKEKLSKEWLTKEEVMELFSVSWSTLKRRIGEQMPYIKKGKFYYFYLKEINEWMKSAV